jgi:hypothetical protein
MSNSIDLSLIKDYAGKYSQSLLMKLYSQLDLGATGITVMPGLKSEFRLTKIIKKKGLKPFTGTEAPRSNGITYEPRILSVAKVQHDDLINPSDYIGTFMEVNRGSGENAANMTIPFAQVVMEAVMKEIADEIVNDAIFNGAGAAAFAAFNAGTVYHKGDLIKYTQENELRYFIATGTTVAGDTPDSAPTKWEWAGARAICKGFGKLIADEITAGNIKTAQVISTGAIANTTAYAQFIQLWRGLPEIVRTKGGLIYTSLSNYEALMDDYENKITKQFEQIDGITYLSKTDRKCQILPVNWLSGSGRLIASPAGNLWMGTDSTSDMNSMKTIEKMYQLQLGLSFMIGFQIADLEPLVVNDQP